MWDWLQNCLLHRWVGLLEFHVRSRATLLRYLAQRFVYSVSEHTVRFARTVGVNVGNLEGIYQNCSRDFRILRTWGAFSMHDCSFGYSCHSAKADPHVVPRSTYVLAVMLDIFPLHISGPFPWSFSIRWRRVPWGLYSVACAMSFATLFVLRVLLGLEKFAPCATVLLTGMRIRIVCFESSLGQSYMLPAPGSERMSFSLLTWHFQTMIWCPLCWNAIPVFQSSMVCPKPPFWCPTCPPLRFEFRWLSMLRPSPCRSNLWRRWFLRCPPVYSQRLRRQLHTPPPRFCYRQWTRMYLSCYSKRCMRGFMHAALYSDRGGNVPDIFTTEFAFPYVSLMRSMKCPWNHSSTE